MFGGWLTVLAGAWFVVGRALAGPLGIGDVGAPVAATETKRVWLELTYFYGLGAVIIFFGAVALGRLSVRTARDIAYVQRPVATYAEQRHVAAAQPQPAPSEEVTEIQPTSTTERHRELARYVPWRRPQLPTASSAEWNSRSLSPSAGDRVSISAGSLLGELHA